MKTDDTKTGTMKGGVRRPRGPSGGWSYYIDVGMAAAQRCQNCGKRFWLERKPKPCCPRCGGVLIETTERHQQVVGGFPTRAAATAARDAARVACREGTHVARASITVAEYLAEWLAHREMDLKPTTHGSYCMHCRCHLTPRIGHVRLQELKPSAIKALYGALQHDAGLSAASTRRVAATLHKALADAVNDGLLPYNPCDRAKPPRINPDGAHEMKSWTPTELGTFLDHVRDERLFAMFRLAAWSGMRRGEIAGLCWSDVDLEAGTLSIQRARVVVHSTDVREGSTKTGRGRRSIELDVVTLTTLKAWRERQCTEQADGEGLVFTDEAGQSLHPMHITRAFARHAKAAGLPQIRFHDLRHTHASILIANGVPVNVVQRRLGHSTAAFTLQAYSHVLPGQQRAEVQRVIDACEAPATLRVVRRS